MSYFEQLPCLSSGYSPIYGVSKMNDKRHQGNFFTKQFPIGKPQLDICEVELICTEMPSAANLCTMTTTSPSSRSTFYGVNSVSSILRILVSKTHKL